MFYRNFHLITHSNSKSFTWILRYYPIVLAYTLLLMSLHTVPYHFPLFSLSYVVCVLSLFSLHKSLVFYSFLVLYLCWICSKNIRTYIFLVSSRHCSRWYRVHYERHWNVFSTNWSLVQKLFYYKTTVTQNILSRWTRCFYVDKINN